ncbi:ABC transporter substrate-binding protein [Marinobacter sp. F3R08]|uniref:ABC transporter substrate-binding protein n=1 Tax=Marinobacter sp. F3R08 TaxID=2841559 RepID=UPI001E514575|nr:ABC transporter substrate-binding protein [Marinobacter sp. F3R08]
MRLPAILPPSMLAGLLLTMISGLSLADERTVDTAFGKVTIEGQPQRIVTLYEGALDTALAVGAHAVGAVITRGGTDVADYIKPRAGDIAIVGTPGETNLEAVIAARPDLILAAPRTSREQFELLSHIAPVVASDIPLFQPDTWKRETRLYAEALGRAGEAEDIIRRVETRAAEVAAVVEQAVQDNERDAILARWMPQGPMIMSTGIFSASLLKAAGFDIRGQSLVDEGRPHSQTLSLENLSAMNQNWIFLATLNEDGRKALDAAKASPAFARLEAVETDQVIPVDGQLWTSASGPLAALAILDEIEDAVRSRP